MEEGPRSQGFVAPGQGTQSPDREESQRTRVTHKPPNPHQICLLESIALVGRIVASIICLIWWILLSAGVCAESGRVPILIDTDIGDDIDDAFALVLALASPELDVRGVTTVVGDAHT